jgi:alkyl hydroperoxide reductase subunit AhpC
VLFSHPKEFTPVCTTELGYMAGLKDEQGRLSDIGDPSLSIASSTTCCRAGRARHV